MAQDRLIRVALGVGVVVAGAAAEVAAGASTALSLMDWTVGVALTTIALRRAAQPVDRLCLLTAALWFLATAVRVPAWAFGAGTNCLVLGYRGTLVHRLVLPTVAGRRAPFVLLAIAYAGPIFSIAWPGMATGAAAGILAVLVAQPARMSGLGKLRRTDGRAVAVLVGLGMTWGLVSLGWLTGTPAILLSDFAVLRVGWHIARSERDSPTTGNVAGMVIELSRSTRPSAPLSASLAEVLADPSLRIATRERDADWRDEYGRPIPTPSVDPETGRVTIVPSPGGGELALLHGPAGTRDSDLSQAAARAAALLTESIRLTAEARRHSEDVENSTARLVTIEEQERHALAERLRTGPMQRLEHARGLLSARDTGKPSEQPILLRLDQLGDDLNRLAHGLSPRAVADGKLPHALHALVADIAVPTTLNLEGSLDSVSGQDAALVYYFIAECLTNITRHADATAATATVILGRTLRIEVTDNGGGGAVPNSGRGLQGLRDRVTLIGGAFGVDSPTGGPTRVWAETQPLE